MENNENKDFVRFAKRWIRHVGSGRHCSPETHSHLVKTVKQLLAIIDTFEGDLGNDR